MEIKKMMDWILTGGKTGKQVFEESRKKEDKKRDEESERLMDEKIKDEVLMDKIDI